MEQFVYQCTECGNCTETCHQSDDNVVLNISNWIDHNNVWNALRKDLVEAGYAPLERHAKLVEYMKAENIIHYGIHPLELAYSVLGAGVEYIQNVGEDDKSIVKIVYKDGRQLLLLVFPEIAQVFQLNLYGKNRAITIEVEDWDYFYWNMLRHFVMMIKEKKLAIPLQETLEIIRVLTSGRESLINGGKKISFV